MESNVNIIQIEKEVDGIKTWYKIQEDNAFEDIIDGWIDSTKKAYMDNVTGRGVCIQAGGYQGIFPRLFSQLFQTVYTFEPEAENFYCLNLNCPQPNIIKNQAALGAKHEMVSAIQRVNSNRGMNISIANEYAEVPTYCIDDLALRSCDFIQLDVEGYEINILHGAKNTINRFRPTISVEDSTPAIESFLSGYGYTAKSISYRDTIYAI